MAAPGLEFYILNDLSEVNMVSAFLRSKTAHLMIYKKKSESNGVSDKNGDKNR